MDTENGKKKQKQKQKQKGDGGRCRLMGFDFPNKVKR
jgi:hypothetical protein